MSNVIEDTISALHSALPPVFAGLSLDALTGGAINWRTIQNARSNPDVAIPPECFIYSGRKVLVRRDPFLSWWRTTLREQSEYTKHRMSLGEQNGPIASKH